MAWNLHAIEQAASGLSARAFSLDRRSRARALLAAVRSVGRRARVAKRSAAARRQQQLETAVAPLAAFKAGVDARCFATPRRTPQPIALLPDHDQC